MKSIKFVRTIVRAATIATLSLGFAALSLAATNPLNEPNGLAVDSKGNLYVANSGGNNILVFNSKYKLIAADTITEGITHPTGVALDPQGNVWVTNWVEGAGNVSEYTAGKQVAGSTITEGVTSPLAVAVDGLGNVWVQNDSSYVDVYSQPVLGVGAPTLTQTWNVTGPLYGISLWENTVALGAPSAFGVGFGDALTTIESGAFQGVVSASNNSGISIAADHKGGFYMSNLDGSVNYNLGFGESNFTQLSYGPAGTAVDPINNRVYFSCFQCNYIQAYSTTTGQLLETIK